MEIKNITKKLLIFQNNVFFLNKSIIFVMLFSVKTFKIIPKTIALVHSVQLDSLWLVGRF